MFLFIFFEDLSAASSTVHMPQCANKHTVSRTAACMHALIVCQRNKVFPLGLSGTVPLACSAEQADKNAPLCLRCIPGANVRSPTAGDESSRKLHPLPQPNPARCPNTQEQQDVPITPGTRLELEVGHGHTLSMSGMFTEASQWNVQERMQVATILGKVYFSWKGSTAIHKKISLSRQCNSLGVQPALHSFTEARQGPDVAHL